MPRVKRGHKRVERRKRILKEAKGYWGTKSKLHRAAKEAVDKARGYAYRDRRTRKRDFRVLWIVRISAAAKENEFSYSRLMNGLRKAGIDLNRKVLAEVAATDPSAFTQLVQRAKNALS
ncbi:MAG: 50S ribosomal protein L20 [Acidobacteria bacterium]|jgi:large subunit ribosomal protein L20|nr:50S ribosomal protein L20 [Acidobacteriota bacterium]